MTSHEDPVVIARVFAELDAQHRRTMAELDERNRLVAEADAEYQRQIQADADVTRAMALDNVRTAIDLARDGHEPRWDWRATIAEYGFTQAELEG